MQTRSIGKEVIPILRTPMMPFGHTNMKYQSSLSQPSRGLQIQPHREFRWIGTLYFFMILTAKTEDECFWKNILNCHLIVQKVRWLFCYKCLYRAPNWERFEETSRLNVPSWWQQSICTSQCIPGWNKSSPNSNWATTQWVACIQWMWELPQQRYSRLAHTSSK